MHKVLHFVPQKRKQQRHDYDIIKNCETLQFIKSADLLISDTKIEKAMGARHHYYHYYHFSAGFSLPAGK